MDPTGIQIENPELILLRNNKETGYNYRRRRQEDWFENYTLYRDKVIVNRLTQRQSVNLPLMKSKIRTALTNVDDFPVIYFQNLDNDKQLELLKNEYWKYVVEKNNLEIQDLVDKRQVFLFGRSFMQLQVIDGMPTWTVQDPQDILVDRFADPFNLHSSRFLTHLHIFRPLSSLKYNPDYDQKAVADMEKWFQNRLGIVKANQNSKMLVEKNRKLAAMGVPDIQSPILGETYVELSLNFVYRDDEKDKNGKKMPPQIFLYVDCENYRILTKKPLEEIMGVTADNYWRNHYPYSTWADDLERQDFWSDGIADIIRVPNNVLNAWFSQMVENRTLQNMNMKYYDATIEGYTPPTNQPLVPGGWYPVPGDPSKVFQSVEVNPLTDSLEEMNFIIGVVDNATGITPTKEGGQPEGQVTLGAVQLSLMQANDRIKGMSKFYTPAWKERGEMFDKLLEGSGDKLNTITVFKEGRNTSNVFSREIDPIMLMTKNGYRVKVWSQDEKDAQDVQQLNALNAAVVNIPNNPKLTEVYQRKILEWAKLTPDQINQIMALEQEKRDAVVNAMAQNGGMGGSPLLGPGGGPSGGASPTPGGGATPIPAPMPTASPGTMPNTQNPGPGAPAMQ